MEKESAPFKREVFSEKGQKDKKGGKENKCSISLCVSALASV